MLLESDYFRNFVDRWSHNQQEDGSYYFDADPDVFEHILNFLKTPTTFPLFWDTQKGFCVALYNKLQGLADYYCLEQLRDWIRAEKYRKAIITKTVTAVKHMWSCEHEGNLDLATYQTYDSSDRVLVKTHWDSTKHRRYNCLMGNEDHFKERDCEPYPPDSLRIC